MRDRRKTPSWVPSFQASKQEYMKWLAGHLANGGDIRYWRDYPFSQRDIRAIPFNQKIKPLHGANSVDFLVKPDVNLDIEDRGHATIYYLEDFSFDGSGAEMFSDIDMKELESMANLLS